MLYSVRVDGEIGKGIVENDLHGIPSGHDVIIEWTADRASRETVSVDVGSDQKHGEVLFAIPNFGDEVVVCEEWLLRERGSVGGIGESKAGTKLAGAIVDGDGTFRVPICGSAIVEVWDWPRFREVGGSVDRDMAERLIWP